MAPQTRPAGQVSDTAAKRSDRRPGFSRADSNHRTGVSRCVCRGPRPLMVGKFRIPAGCFSLIHRPPSRRRNVSPRYHAAPSLSLRCPGSESSAGPSTDRRSTSSRAGREAGSKSHTPPAPKSATQPGNPVSCSSSQLRRASVSSRGSSAHRPLLFRLPQPVATTV